MQNDILSKRAWRVAHHASLDSFTVLQSTLTDILTSTSRYMANRTSQLPKTPGGYLKIGASMLWPMTLVGMTLMWGSYATMLLV